MTGTGVGRAAVTGGAADVIGGGAAVTVDVCAGDGVVLTDVVSGGAAGCSPGCVTSVIVAVFSAAGRSAMTST